MNEVIQSQVYSGLDGKLEILDIILNTRSSQLLGFKLCTSLALVKLIRSLICFKTILIKTSPCPSR